MNLIVVSDIKSGKRRRCKLKVLFFLSFLVKIKMYTLKLPGTPIMPYLQQVLAEYYQLLTDPSGHKPKPKKNFHHLKCLILFVVDCLCNWYFPQHLK